MDFRNLGLDPRVLRAVDDAGYTEPTPIQAAAIPVILSGRDLIGIAQTGTGKTAAFTLPLLTRLAAGHSSPGHIRTLVLAPTRELVVQIHDNVRDYARYLSLSVATVFGGVGEKPQIEALRRGADLVIATPGRLLDLMGRRYGNFSGIGHLVLDEADRMLDMGFLPAIRDVVRQLPRRRQTLLFSATLSREIEAVAGEFLQSPQSVEIGRRSNPAETVDQSVYEVPRHLKGAMLQQLLRDPALSMVLVFARMKHGADRIARRLEQHGVRTATLHSNRSQNQRLRALAEFKGGAVRVLVATDIAARGIDVDGISHVVNYDFPPAPEDYVHRIGRTGRAQAVGSAISLVSPDEADDLRALETFIRRTLPRRRLEGFDYSAPAPAASAEPPRGGPRGGPRHGRGPQGARPSRGPSSPGPGPRPPGGGGRSAGASPRGGTFRPRRFR
ncbi:MAG: DEAD/DEAH box helicase [Verrucomicrobia bacterium]|nr:DEAD/DEAH box helicase [Verrucomicrobiota bacterium]